MEEKKFNNKKGLITTICVALAFLIGLYFTYTKILNPKTVFVKSINKGYEKLENFIDDKLSTTTSKKPIMMTNDIKFSMDVDKNMVDSETKEMMEIYNKLKISETIGIDQKNNEMILAFKYLYGNEDIMNIGAYLKDEKWYIELKNALDKYIEIPTNGTKTTANNINLSKDEIKYLLSKTKDAFVNNMNSKDFKQTSEKIKNGKKTIKVTKITYNFSEKTSKELSKKLTETLMKDSKYIKIIAKATNRKESEVKESMKKSIEESNKAIKNGNLSKEVTFKLGVLVKGITKKHVGYYLESNGSKFVYYKNGKNKEIRLGKDDKDIIRVSTKNDKTVVTLVSGIQEIEININKKEKENKTIYEFDLDISGVRLSGNVTVEKIKENKDGTGEEKITFEASVMGLITFKVTDNIKIEYVDKLDMPNISNSIKIEDLTPEEIEKIKEKIINKEALKSFSNVTNTSGQFKVY